MMGFVKIAAPHHGLRSCFKNNFQSFSTDYSVNIGWVRQSLSSMTGLGKAVKRHSLSLAPTHDRIMAVFNWQPRIYMIAFALLAITTAYLPFMLGASPTPTTDPFFWGPYRSNLYFGIRATTPNSPLIGLMWYDSQDPNGVNST